MDKYLEQIAFNYISLILNSVGFERANKSTCEVLEEIYCQYLENLGRELKKCSEHHGATEVSIEDLVYYFEDAGIKCRDLELMLQNGIQIRKKKNNSKLLVQIKNNKETLKLMLSQLENNGTPISNLYIFNSIYYEIIFYINILIFITIFFFYCNLNRL